MSRVLGAASVIVALAAAGCLQPSDLETASAPAALAPPMHDMVAFAADGALRMAGPAFEGFHVELLETGFLSGEPSIGVTSDGAIFVTSGGPNVGRSTDNGMTWEDLKGRDPVREPKRSFDPWVWVDPLTDRVFNAPLYIVCTWASWSDDGGESWDFNPLTGCGIPAHDHQKLTTGPPAEGVTVDGYDNVVYYSYNSFRGEGTWITASYDGGRTYEPGVGVFPDDQCHSGIASPVMTAPDGTAYSGHPTCSGVSMAVSHDSGASWSEPIAVDDVGAAKALAHMVDVATDAANNAYVTWTGEDGAAYVTSTTDSGDTWSKPKRVSPPTLGATVYNVITAGADGQVVVGFIGTEADATKWDSADAQSAPDDTVWHVYLSYVDDAASDDPMVTTIQLTPDDDPVQIGCIWQSGGVNDCRNLGDFIDLTMHEGRPYLVYADGCDACTKNTDSRGRDVVVAVVQVGPSLLGGLLEPLEMHADDGHGHDASVVDVRGSIARATGAARAVRSG